MTLNKFKYGDILEYTKKGSSEEKWWKCKFVALDDGEAVVKMESGRYHRRPLSEFRIRLVEKA